ncbi:MAG TPA: DUF2142 domain-containing protein [Acidimicrobiales bacterium]|nr:DUF2142 domain-containing protein [Acidimicrobiales bacterium]
MSLARERVETAPPTGDAPDPDRDDRAPARAPAPATREPGAWRWAALFVLPYLLVAVAWVFSNPPGAAPDEPDHLVKAIGMGRLDIGDDYGRPLPREGPPLRRRNLSITRVVDVPAGIVPAGYTCYAFDPNKTAACLPVDEPTGRGTVAVETPIGAYPPFAYVGMGLAARAMGTPYHAFLAARLVALVTALALVFVGAWFLVRELGPPALLGAFVALTPMAIFAAASVTTSGLEIASGFATGALVVVCLRRPDALLAPRTQVALAVAGTCLVLSRQMGAVALAVLLAILAAGCRRQAWRLVREHRPAFVGSVALLGASGLAVALWERAYDHPTDTGSPLNVHAIDSFVPQAQGLIDSAIGVFGWLDSPMPVWAYWSWLAVATTVCGMALLLGGRRDRLVLAAGLAATVLVTFGSYAAVFFPVGAGSQGRHLLPLLVFCPTYAAVVVVDRLRAAGLVVPLRRLFVAVAVVAGGLQLAGLYYNARRYAVGVDGSLLFFGEAEWSPRLGWLPWLLIGLVGAALLVRVALASRPPLTGTAPLTAGEM